MTNRVLLSVALALFVAGLSARADLLIVRTQEAPIKGTIKSEDATKVMFAPVAEKGKKVEPITVPAGDVLDMILDDGISPPTLTAIDKGAYRLAVEAEKAADTDDAATRKTKLAAAVASYTETHKKMIKNNLLQKNAARHVQYKVAFLMSRQAVDQLSRDQAVRKLEEFKTEHANSWQIHRVMPLIAQLQMESEDFAKAAKTFEEMSGMTTLSPEMRRDAKLRVVDVFVRAKQLPKAYETLDKLEQEAKMANNDAFTARVNLARADILIGQNQFDKATPILLMVVSKSNDKQVKGLAHNALGEGLFKAGKHNEALWEFLWVDAVFNQDREQHAKALYYLWKTFEQLNNQERANDCRDMLLNDRQFIGTEFQRKAQDAK